MNYRRLLLMKSCRVA